MVIWSVLNKKFDGVFLLHWFRIISRTFDIITADTNVSILAKTVDVIFFKYIIYT